MKFKRLSAFILTLTFATSATAYASISKIPTSNRKSVNIQVSRNSNNLSKVKSSNKAKIKNKSNVGSTKKYNKNKLTEQKAFKIAVKTTKNYFKLNGDESKFKLDKISDMKTYWIVFISNGKESFQVRISLQDKKPFFISRNISSNYKNKPISKDASKKIADNFIKSSPLKNTKLKFLKSSYELKFNSSEKEYYVFEYVKQNKDPKNPQNLIIVKVNTFSKAVSEISF
ncbi:MAG: hypothetical protein VB130_10935 [Clostridium sp.]|nr:hypothetical protein [Clostridium sp.]